MKNLIIFIICFFGAFVAKSQWSINEVKKQKLSEQDKLISPPLSSRVNSTAHAIWGVGVQIGSVEFGSFFGADPSLLVQSLTYARDLAIQSNCIPTAEIEQLRLAMANTYNSKDMYQSIVGYRMRLAEHVNKYCNCGNIISPDDININSPNACNRILGSGIHQKWTSNGGETGRLGCPDFDEKECEISLLGTQGKFTRFSKGEGAYIIWHQDGKKARYSFLVEGCHFKLYQSMGGTKSWLGFPISDEYSVSGGKRQDFEGGYMLWNASTAKCAQYSYNQAQVPLRWSTVHEHVGCNSPQSFCTRYDKDPIVFSSLSQGNLEATYRDIVLKGTLSGTYYKFQYFRGNSLAGSGQFTFSTDFRSFSGTFEDPYGHRGNWTGHAPD